MKRMLSILLLLTASSVVQAFELTEENRLEIDACWRRIFKKEMVLMESHEQRRSLKNYRNYLLDIQDEDMQPVGQLVGYFCKGDLWDAFLADKSVDATVAYIRHLMKGLNAFIGHAASFAFPLKLQEVRSYLKTGIYDSREECTKMRRAFLAFTIIVSKMEYLATH